METYHIDNVRVRELDAWRNAVVLCQYKTEPSMTKGYYTARGKYIPSHSIPSVTVRECQDWRKTCRAYARVHGEAVVVHADDTVSVFRRLTSGRISVTRKAAKITWTQENLQN